MLEIGIRTFSWKKGTSLSNDYKKQMAFIKTWMDGKIESSLRETESTFIYQYYSVMPFYYLEARFLRRIQAGVSVMYVKESVEEYIESIHLPRFIKKFFYSYVKIFLNSLDYIVTADDKTKTALKEEGIKNPSFYKISENKEKEFLTAGSWLSFYQVIARGI